MTKKSTKPKYDKPGAPTLYKPEYCQMVQDHMAKGYSLESFAAIVDVGKRTIYEWIDAVPEFSHACEQGREKARFYWEDTGIKGANGKIRNFNAGVWTFWMKNRFKWHDNVVVTQDLNAKVETKSNIEELANKLTEIHKTINEIK